MAQLAFEGVTKVFPDGTEAVRDFDLDVGDGELMILVGPSGSGKSTALRMLAGLEDATAGTIRIGTRVVNDVAPKDRDIAMVFQSYALYPHMDVAHNLGFALRMQRMQRASIGERVSAAAQRLGLSELVGKRPKNLSGGQRQRVAVGRAIVRQPQAFLMDEPLSNLDAKLRVEMRAYLSRLRQELGTTTVYVTHDQIEAMTMGDRVAVMRDGRLVQCDRPQTLYDRPADLFVAGFIGSPAMNFARGRLERAGDGLHLVLGSQRMRLPDHLPDAVLVRDGAPVVLGIRPEALSHAPAGEQDDHVLEATVELVESLGSDLLVHAELDAPAVLTEDQLEVAREVGGDPAAGLARARFTARLAPDVAVATGDRVRLRVDMERLHFFDPDTTLALR
jgi:multiple sugar transport system ATP-binding protein